MVTTAETVASCMRTLDRHVEILHSRHNGTSWRELRLSPRYRQQLIDQGAISVARPVSPGEHRNPHPKLVRLTEDQKAKLIAMCANGQTVTEIAAAFRVSYTTGARLMRDTLREKADRAHAAKASLKP